MGGGGGFLHPHLHWQLGINRRQWQYGLKKWLNFSIPLALAWKWRAMDLGCHQADLPAQQHVILLFCLSYCRHSWRKVSDKLTYLLNNTSFCCSVFLTVVIAGERWVTSWPTPLNNTSFCCFCLSHCRHCWGKVSDKLTYPTQQHVILLFLCFSLSSLLGKSEWQADLSTQQHVILLFLSFSLSSLLEKGEWQADLPAQQYVILLLCLSHCRLC